MVASNQPWASIEAAVASANGYASSLTDTDRTAGIGVMAALRHNRSATIQNIGDSTGDATNEWLALLGLSLGGKFDCNVQWRPWNDTNQSYDSPTFLRTAAGGERAVLFSSGALVYTSPAVTGDIEVVARVKPNTWAAAGTIASRYAGSGNQRGFRFGLTASKNLTWSWSADGATDTIVNSTAAVGFADGSAGWVRVSFDVDNGASGNATTFYTSPDGITWTQLGTTITNTGVTSIFASTQPYKMGAEGSAVSNPFAGNIYWLQIRDAVANGKDVVPPLPDDWEQISSIGSSTVLTSGKPNLLLLCGSKAGQNIAYFDETTRKTKLNAPHGQDLVILSDGHNDTAPASGYLALYSSWVTNVRTLQPGVPIVVLSQNPVRVGATYNQNNANNRAQRSAMILTWAVCQAGMWAIDTYRAFTNMTTMISSDDLHPTHAGDPEVTSGLSGQESWTALLMKELFPLA